VPEAITIPVSRRASGALSDPARLAASGADSEVLGDCFTGLKWDFDWQGATHTMALWVVLEYPGSAWKAQRPIGGAPN